VETIPRPVPPLPAGDVRRGHRQDHVTEPLRARCATTGSTTPTSSPARAAAARPRARGSWPGRSTASRRRSPTRAASASRCRDLARGGPGSIDVIEIDAASHGGVDDARDLRETAFFAPVSSRYKVYIIDEAHMVSTQGFNALLKLVEEPPEHLKFIFATTEPEKVIPTIRSRTHHYPFRLIPPRTLSDYLAELCDKEG
jgi:DNA polymerase-3 subunit gamma/tau